MMSPRSKMRKWPAGTVVMMAASLGAGGAAWAQTPEPPAAKPAPVWLDDGESDDEEPYIPPASDEADSLLEEARALQKENRHPDAILKLEEAFSLQPRADIAAELGESKLMVGRYAEAADDLTFATARLAGSNPLSERAATSLTRARAKVATVYVTLDPPDAKLTVDDGPARTLTPGQPIHLSPGVHRLQASRPGDATASVDVEAVPGATEEVALTLSGGGGTASSQSYVWAWWLGIGGALTVGTLVAGGVLRAQGDGAISDAEEARAGLNHNDRDDAVCRSQPAVCQAIADDAADGDRLRNTSTGLFIAGGTLAAATAIGTIVLATLPDDPGSGSIPYFIPALGPNYAGMSVSGHW
ncbi:MAG: hypothetical protein AAF715_31730 [Myxococcota bacterium]